ncbi:unnamed protein product [Diamesa hyperborea]
MKLCLLVLFAVVVVHAYDPEDKEIEKIIPMEGTFEAFYPRESHGIANSVARAPHGHGSFFQHRNPGETNISQLSLNTYLVFKLLALIDVKNAAAYGFRFDGKRRFNFD